MNRNRIAIAAALAVMIVGAVALCCTPSKPHARLVAYAEKIDGNAALAPAPATYLVACYPKNWKADSNSQAMTSELAKVAKRPGVVKQVYVDGDADFEHRFQSDHNTGPISPAKLPCTLVMHDNQKVYCASGNDVRNCGDTLQKLLDRFPCKPKEPETPKVEPERPVVPDTPDTTEPTKTEDVNTPAVFAILGFVGLTVWGIMFRHRPT